MELWLWRKIISMLCIYIILLGERSKTEDSVLLSLHRNVFCGRNILIDAIVIWVTDNSWYVVGNLISGRTVPFLSSTEHPCCTTYSVGFGLFQATKLNLTKIRRISNTLHTDKWTDKHMDGQTEKHPDKHATTLLLNSPLASAEEHVICCGRTLPPSFLLMWHE